VYFNAIEEKFGSLIKLLLKMNKTARKAIYLQKPSCTFCTECQLLTPKYSGVHPGSLFGCHDRPLCATGTQH